MADVPEGALGGDHGNGLLPVEVWTPKGLQTYYVLFFIELETRRVHVAGITTNPTDWLIGKAVERVAGHFKAMRYVIHDRDTKYSLRFRIVVEDAGVTPIKTPFQAPNANAYAERFVRSIKDECLNRMILFGEGHYAARLTSTSRTITMSAIIRASTTS